MKISLSLILFCTIMAVLAPCFVQAEIIKIDNPLKYDKIEDIIPAITSVLKGIAISIGVIMIIIGGIQIMTGMMTGEKESKVLKGKKTVTWTVIGVAIVILVDFIVGIVKELLGAE